MLTLLKSMGTFLFTPLESTVWNTVLWYMIIASYVHIGKSSSKTFQNGELNTGSQVA